MVFLLSHLKEMFCANLLDISVTVTILAFTILDQTRNRGYFHVLMNRNSDQCLETHAIGVAVLRLYSLVGRSILCSSSDGLCI